MSAVLEESKLWRDLISGLGNLFPEVHFVFVPSGVELLQLDSSKAVMADLKLPRATFKSWGFRERVDVLLNMEVLLKFNKLILAEDQLRFTHLPDKESIEVVMNGEFSRSFSLPLLTPGTQKTNIPKMDPTVRIELSTDALKKAIKHIGIVAGQVDIAATEGMLAFSGEGSDGAAEVILQDYDEAVYEIDVEEDAFAYYSRSYLSAISKCILSDVVILEFSTHRQLHVKSTLGIGGSLDFILAPRVPRDGGDS